MCSDKIVDQRPRKRYKRTNSESPDMACQAGVDRRPVKEEIQNVGRKTQSFNHGRRSDDENARPEEEGRCNGDSEISSENNVEEGEKACPTEAHHNLAKDGEDERTCIDTPIVPCEHSAGDPADEVADAHTRHGESTSQGL